ncbi:hypothetical protein SASPL_123800 [Salvia splendens]|uniref:phosphoglycerate kinase n=1 Tax=Salvia splendens TaxID=180675 RepID=A0A8X8XRV0_SALSN|nr:hypothetical protein SASPL_123800 [Salvia splendens]
MDLEVPVELAMQTIAYLRDQGSNQGLEMIAHLGDDISPYKLFIRHYWAVSHLIDGVAFTTSKTSGLGGATFTARYASSREALPSPPITQPAGVREPSTPPARPPVRGEAPTLPVGSPMWERQMNENRWWINPSSSRVDCRDLRRELLNIRPLPRELAEIRPLLREADKIGPLPREPAGTRTVPASAIPDGWMGLDIGPDSIKSFGEALDSTKTIIWNGPMGVFEFGKFAAGTEAIAKKLAELSGKGVTTIIGGGDSVAAVEKVGLAEKMSHISTGGGASLELLEGKTLPGVLALNDA